MTNSMHAPERRFPVSRAVLGALAGAALALSMAQAGAAANDGRCEEAKAAFASASGSRDGNHAGYVRAYSLWSELAQEGDTRALYHLGIMNMFGIGGAEFEQNLAMQRIRAAADAGYAQAQSYLGFVAENGDGALARRGDEVALSWWRKGAQGNHCVAIRRMAKAYRNGELGLEADAAKAAEWAAREAGCERN